MYDKCPECGGNPIIYDIEFHAYVCPHCGLVINDRPLVYQFYQDYGGYYYREKIVVKQRNTWLRAGVEVIEKLCNDIFKDECIFKIAIQILREMHDSEFKLPSYEAAAKFAVLVASRKCNKHVDSKKLFKSISELYELLIKHSYLQQYYTPPTKELALNIALNTIKCLGENNDKITETIKKLVEKINISVKPLTLAILLVYTAHIVNNIKLEYKHIAKCLETTENTVKQAIIKHSRKIHL